MKRKREFRHIENQNIKQENRRSITDPASLTRSVSPPVVSRRKPSQLEATTVQVEAGEKDIEDHLSFFSSKLHSASRTITSGAPRLDHQSWVDLYTSNINNPQGHHFVIHQHDHPVSGTHYDLRLQCNETSSVSWAIMYGLPGDPNSRRLNRNATETRIHCLWNHLTETASHQTGTLLIWDTGCYEVLQYSKNAHKSLGQTTDEDESEPEENLASDRKWSLLSEPEKLHVSFQNRKIRLRLHGVRLPRNYTISIRLSKDNDRTKQPAAPKTRRKKSAPSLSKSRASKPFQRGKATEGDHDTDTEARSTSDTDAVVSRSPRLGRKVSSLHRYESPPPATLQKPTTAFLTTDETRPTPIPTQDSNLNTKLNTPASSNPLEPTDTTKLEPEPDLIRLTNAYPGATNSINSIHQRRWYLSLDASSSGFTRPPGQRWTWPHPFPRPPYPFHVLGPTHERSVVTGRLAADILADEGVAGYVPRGKWRAVVE